MKNINQGAQDKTERVATARYKAKSLKSFNVPLILVEHGENRPPTEFYRKTLIFAPETNKSGRG